MLVAKMEGSHLILLTLVSRINEHARLIKFWSFSSLLALIYYIKMSREDTAI